MSFHNASWLQIAARLAPALAGTALLTFLFINADWDQMALALKRADGRILVLSTFLGATTIALGILRWQVLLGVFGVKVSFAPLTRLVLEGTAVNLAIPGGFAGDFARAVGIRNLLVNAGDAVSSVITDRLIGLLGFVAFALLALAVRWNDLNNAAVAVPTLVIGAAIVATICIIYSRRLAKPLFKLLGRIPAIQHLADLMSKGMLTHRQNYRALALAFGLALSGHLFQILTTWTIGLSLGINVDFFTYVLYVPIVALLAAVPISHFGIGVREGGFILLLGASLVSKELALLLSVIFSIIAIFIPALIGFCFILVRLVRTGKFIERA